MTRQAPATPPTPAAEPYLRVERARSFGRFGLLLVLAAAVWTVVVYPDARRVPVACTVLEHYVVPHRKLGVSGAVRVRVDDAEYDFTVIGASREREEVDRELAAWPVGSVQTCWKLPYPVKFHVVEAHGASWVPPLALLLAGLALIAWGAWRSTRPLDRRVDVPPAGHPFREAGERAPPPARLALDAHAFDAGRRKLARGALGLWALQAGALIALGATAPSPAGTLFEPESPLRNGLFVFALLELGIPFGILLWLGLHALLSRRGVWLDAACGGAVGVARGVPGLRSVSWSALPADLTLTADALVTTDGTPLASFPRGEADRRAVEAWLEVWRSSHGR
jgi:hypothetical protein